MLQFRSAGQQKSKRRQKRSEVMYDLYSVVGADQPFLLEEKEIKSKKNPKFAMLMEGNRQRRFNWR